MASPIVATALPDRTDLEETPISADFSGNFSDTDISDSISYSISGLPAGTGFVFDTATGVLSGSPSTEDMAQDNVITVTATDEGGQTAQITFTLFGDPQVGVGGINWGPSHGIKIQGDHATESTSGQAAYQQGVLDDMDSKLTADPIFEWATVKLAWGVINPTGTTYDFDFPDAVLNKAAALGKRVIFQLASDTSNGDSPQVEGDPTAQDIIPADLKNNYTAQTGSSAQSFMFEPVVYQRYQAMLVAFAERYDGHPQLEGVRTAESAPSWKGNRPAGYSSALQSVALQAIVQTLSDNFQKTNCFLTVNSLSGEEENLIEACYQARIGVADPDLAASEGDIVFAGGNDAVRDYRGQLPKFNIASAPVLGGKDNELPLSHILQEMSDVKCTHMGWTEKDDEDMLDEFQGGPDGDIDWATIVTAIGVADGIGNSLHTACPTRYTSCNVV